MENCPECGLPPESDEYTLPLCSACRTRMSQRPFPGWVIASTVVAALVLIWAFTKFPAAVNAGIAYERGQRAERAGDYAAAVGQYKVTVQYCPDSTLTLSRLVICQCKTGDINGVAETMRALEGKKASEDLVREVNDAILEATSKNPVKEHR